MDFWGQHHIIDAKSCTLEKVIDKEHITQFIKELVKRIDMVPYGEPSVVHFADGTELAGWTASQLITTSNITAHFLDNNGDLYLDVFSCKKFNTQDVIDVLNEYFKPQSIKTKILYRQA